VAWDAVGDLLPRAGLLVNTTSLGMKASRRSNSMSGVAVTRRRRRSVYVPLDTPLLAAAAPAG
jgi:shikimate dehydrogenase